MKYNFISKMIEAGEINRPYKIFSHQLCEIDLIFLNALYYSFYRSIKPHIRPQLKIL
jgi:hypothetical protein